MYMFDYIFVRIVIDLKFKLLEIVRYQHSFFIEGNTNTDFWV